MQIHLSKPGGQREGPFTVEQVNRDLAAGRYNDNDYWAWYEGLASWIPLHSVPGIKAHGGSTNQDTTVVPKVEEEPNPQLEDSVALEPVERAADPVAADECDGEAENEAAALTDYAPEPERETESRVSHPQNFLSENQESQLSSQ